MTRRRPRVLILAQIPPPTHGQSVMVGHLVRAAEERHPDQFLHVNLLLSKDEEDVGTLRPAKLIPLAWCALKAIVACTLRGARDIYYVPAPGKRAPIIRDVLLLSILKPFTRHFILHWHAVGLGEYLQNHPEDWWGRQLRKLLQQHKLSICLSESTAEDVKSLAPREITIIPNGIPDPCPDFPTVWAARRQRLALRRRALTDASMGPVPVHLLYLGLCIRSKGIFAVLSTAAALADQLNRSHRACRILVTVAGPFPDEAESAEFDQAVSQVLHSLPLHAEGFLAIERPGFTGPAAKRQLLETADLFIFHTRYENEGLPLTLLEALGVGLPILTSRWRSIPEALPENYPWFAPSQEALPRLAIEALHSDSFEELREWFLKSFTLDAHLAKMLASLTETDFQLQTS